MAELLPSILTFCSGKSSVLEGLTGIPYPRNSSLCTRYATQITFRRAPNAVVSVSIIPAADAAPEYAEKLRKWKKTDLNLFDGHSFSAILKEVGFNVDTISLYEGALG